MAFCGPYITSSFQKLIPSLLFNWSMVCHPATTYTNSLVSHKQTTKNSKSKTTKNGIDSLGQGLIFLTNNKNPTMRIEIVSYWMVLETRVGPTCLREAGVGSGFQGHNCSFYKENLFLWTQEIAMEEIEQHVII